MLITKNNKSIPLSNSAAKIKDKSGNIIGVILIFRDISEQKRIEERNQRYQEDLKKAYKKLKSTQEQLMQSEKMADVGQ